MCGVTGFWERRPGTPADELAPLAERMTRTLDRRGPDDHGVWVDPASGIGLGMTRLAIVDLSPAGHQPMVSACGRLVIVFNGEVYNFAELRADLERAGQTFRGHSDTEVILAGFATWGIEATIRRAIGMFAIAVWNRETRELTLIRDRLGIKPLYYGQFGRTVLFGSELKSLRAHPQFQSEIDRGVLGLYVRHNYIPGPESIYRGVFQLPPGCSLTIRATDDSLPAPRPYWSLAEIVRAGLASPFSGTADEADRELERRLIDSIRLRMIADVPLGAFLSGGIDSSLVVALMQQQSSRPVKTFTIGFAEAEYNEAPYAKAVAEHLRTDHVEYYVTPQEALDVIPLLPAMYDEPFADSSQIPTFLVSRLARQHVTVSLSGDGGDELFCGYRRYLEFERLSQLAQAIPKPLRQTAVAMANTVARGLPGHRLPKVVRAVARLLDQPDPHAIYLRHLMHWTRDDDVVVGATNIPTLFDCDLGDPRSPAAIAFPSLQQRWMALDTATYLPGDILTKVDRASMFASLEARVPLLDHRVVEFAWTLPMSLKRNGSRGKLPLRRLLAKHVPTNLFERPKTGFGVPIDRWLRGPLRDWAESLLDERRLRDQGLFRPELIRARWQQHQNGSQSWHYPLWTILMFQAWLDHTHP